MPGEYETSLGNRISVVDREERLVSLRQTTTAVCSKSEISRLSDEVASKSRRSSEDEDNGHDSIVGAQRIISRQALTPTERSWVTMVIY